MALKITHEWTCDLCGKGVENFAGYLPERDVQTVNDIGHAVLCLRNLPTGWSYAGGKFICTRHTITAETLKSDSVVLREGRDFGG